MAVFSLAIPYWVHSGLGSHEAIAPGYKEISWIPEQAPLGMREIVQCVGSGAYNPRFPQGASLPTSLPAPPTNSQVKLSPRSTGFFLDQPTYLVSFKICVLLVPFSLLRIFIPLSLILCEFRPFFEALGRWKSCRLRCGWRNYSCLVKKRKNSEEMCKSWCERWEGPSCRRKGRSSTCDLRRQIRATRVPVQAQCETEPPGSRRNPNMDHTALDSIKSLVR